MLNWSYSQQRTVTRRSVSLHEESVSVKGCVSVKVCIKCKLYVQFFRCVKSCRRRS